MLSKHLLNAVVASLFWGKSVVQHLIDHLLKPLQSRSHPLPLNRKPARLFHPTVLLQEPLGPSAPSDTLWSTSSIGGILPEHLDCRWQTSRHSPLSLHHLCSPCPLSVLPATPLPVLTGHSFCRVSYTCTQKPLAFTFVSALRLGTVT